ncbi:conserved hypothetical protein [Candidatus Zixiibacteriota bacterium]|nr:conserved hypothetical protein [candidate division Zixibacteria bacterium]
MPPIHWIVLGSASGIPSATRACSGYLLKINDDLILFDCGSGVVSSLLRFQIDPHQIKAVFISHMHSDHISDLTFLLQLMYQKERSADLIIYLPEEGLQIFRAYLTAVYLMPEKYPFHLWLRAIDDKIISFCGSEISAHPTTHLKTGITEKVVAQYNLPNKMQSYAFEINVENGRRILYSSDIAVFSDVEKYLKNLDLFIIETTHIALEKLPELLSDYNIRKTVLTHLSDDAISQVKNFIDDFSGTTELVIAEDGLTVSL